MITEKRTEKFSQPTVESIKLETKQDIQKHLPDATNEQVERFAIEFERLRLLKEYFSKYSNNHQSSPHNAARESEENLHLILANAKKKLNYKRPYRIAVIGDKNCR